MLPDFQWSHLHRSKEQIQTRNIDTRITLQISSNIKTYHVYISSYQVIECDSVKLNMEKITADVVRMAYRLFLNRDAETDAALNEKVRSFSTYEELRHDFILSPEFR